MNILRSIFGGGSDDQSGRKSVRVMSVIEAQAAINGDSPPFILDVREPYEFASGHIDGAALIPLGQLERRVGELSKDTPILCVCQSGSRSSAAAQMLAQAGFDAINLRGGMMNWQMAGFPVTSGGTP
jgi:rhodanese-related sulfurtransferase